MTAVKTTTTPAPTAAAATREILWFWAVATCIKLLLIPSYHSTDFEVHRHWFALTHSLPLARWYADDSSIWTLDYPPLFAYFQRLLALPAAAVDPAIVSLASPTDYAFPAAILFLRISVSAFADLALLLSAFRILHAVSDAARRRTTAALLICSPALLIVDHIHFQYNGYLLGILLLSLSLMQSGRDLAGGFAFAVLICSKHLFMVAAPLYFVYLLRHYCVGGVWRATARFLFMGMAVGAVFAVAFGPFVYYGQIQQVLSRMFPFGRGLCHAYWAPNFWVFYIILDKVLAFTLTRLGFEILAPKASFTGGLVGNTSNFSILPQVTPLVTFLLVIVAMSPCLFKAFRNPRPKNIIRWASYAYTCGFMFGWHVHEKASLHFVIPFSIIAMNSIDDARHYFLLSIVTCYSQFPLLFEPQEYPIKVLLLVIYSIIMWIGFTSYFSSSQSDKSTLNIKNYPTGWVGLCYLIGLVGVEVWGQVLQPYVFGSRFPFVPLMLVSIYCAIGMMYSWLWQLRHICKYT